MFKEYFKYYKSKKLPPDLNEIIDFNNLKVQRNCIIQRIKLKDTAECFFGLKPISQWSVLEVSNSEGLIVIKNPFTEIGQLYWAVRCLKDYPKKPNKSNLDAHDLLLDNEDWWSKSQGDAGFLNKLRWVTFGYHHNWDTKVYSENSKSVFPSDLGDLCKYLAQALDFRYFQPEAAIVNYYHMDSTLSGHTDHSEEDLDAPLFSFSFGQTAIFLLGGTTVDVKPTAMFLHSGDIMMMSQKSRLCYHGVPKILASNEKPWKIDQIKEIVPHKFQYLVNKLYNSNFVEPFEEYLKNSRININVRQVLKPGQQRLSKD